MSLGFVMFKGQTSQSITESLTFLEALIRRKWLSVKFQCKDVCVGNSVSGAVCPSMQESNICF